MFRACLFLNASADPFRWSGAGALARLRAALPDVLLYTQSRALGEQIVVGEAAAHAGVAEFGFDDLQRALALVRNPAALAPLWSDGASVAAGIVGRDHVIMRRPEHRAAESIKGVFPFRCRADVPAAAFQRHWLHTHGPIAARTESATCYVQCHPPATWRESAPVYHALTEIYWPDAEAARRAMRSRQMREDQAGDAANFADPDGVVLLLATEEVVLGW
jgi:uncharacterized protein (TIGR02118 family)